MEDRKSGMRRVNESCALHSNPSTEPGSSSYELLYGLHYRTLPLPQVFSAFPTVWAKAIKEVCTPYLALFAAQAYVAPDSWADPSPVSIQKDTLVLCVVFTMHNLHVGLGAAHSPPLHFITLKCPKSLILLADSYCSGDAELLLHSLRCTMGYHPAYPESSS